MEWYAVQMCQVPAEAASFFGALQLIALAAIWLFKIPLPCPEKEGIKESGLAGGDLQNGLLKQDRA